VALQPAKLPRGVGVTLGGASVSLGAGVVVVGASVVVVGAGVAVAVPLVAAGAFSAGVPVWGGTGAVAPPPAGGWAAAGAHAARASAARHMTKIFCIVFFRLTIAVTIGLGLTSVGLMCACRGTWPCRAR
jgi:hypothetical protein